MDHRQRQRRRSRIPVKKEWENRQPSDSVETSSQGSSSSDSSSSESSILCDSYLLPLMRYTPLIDKFPSSMSPSHGFVINWLNGPPGQEVGALGHIAAISETSRLLRQVTNYFDRKSESSQIPQLINSPVWRYANRNRPIFNFQGTEEYLWKVIDIELEKENRYATFFIQETLPEEKVQLRKNAVLWIITAGRHFQYALDTVHIAVYIIDAFIYSQSIKPAGWPLLTLTAFQLAGKLEEMSRKKLHQISREFKNMARFQAGEVMWMEEIILRNLKFHVSPSSAKLFVDLAVNGGRIQFPTEEAQRIISNLAQDLLLKSLLDFSHFHIRNSLKAEFALQVATEYVLYYWNIYTGRRFDPVILEDVKGKAVKVCYSLFEGLIQAEKSSPRKISTRKAVRGV